MSGAMTTGQAAVIEPILTEHARGYTNSEMVAARLFPVVDIPNRSMRVIRFGKEDFRRVQTRRAPGAATGRLEFGYASDPVSLPQDSLEAVVPTETQEEAAKVPGFDLGRISVDRVLAMAKLGVEIDSAGLARNPATYAAGNKLLLSGSSRWNDDASKPKDDVDAARDVVRRQIGRKPNVLMLGSPVASALQRHARIKEQFKYTSADSVTVQMLARYFDIDEVVVGEGVYLPDTAADDAAAQDIWGNDAILAYVNKGKDYQSPSFGYNYRLKGYPIVEAPYHERNRKSWIYPVTWEERPYVTGGEAGFLFQNAGG